MIFDVNQVDFPSERHKEIWNIGRLVIPLDVSLADITESETREGCKQIYSYTQDILEDIYKNPEAYPNQRIFDICSRQFDWFIKFNAKLDESGLNWIMPASEYKRGKHHYCDFSIMNRFGFSVEHNDDFVVIKNNNYPLFLKYWYLLYRLAEKRGVNRLNYMMYCDFRLFVPKYKRMLDDLFRTLSNEYRTFFKELHEHAISKGAKLESHKYYGRFRYLYKKDFVLALDIHPIICIPYSLKANWHNSIESFLNEAEKQSDKDELIKYIQDEICLCNGCNKDCGSFKAPPTDIYGKKRLKAGCHSEISKWKKPRNKQVYTDYDIQMLKRMMDIRFAQIDDHTK